MKNLIFTITIFLLTAPCFAGGVYQTQESFLAEVFSNEIPKPQVIWPDNTLKKTIKNILGHSYKSLRIRYWKNKNRTAWILDEIGKEKPITTGIVVNNKKIELVRVLIFRESRGWEVRHSFFTEQFNEAALKGTEADKIELDKNIDNISGATLSVRAVTKLARLALLLDKHVSTQQDKVSNDS